MPTITFPQSLFPGDHQLQGGGSFNLSDNTPAATYTLTKLTPIPPVDIWGADFSKHNGVVDFGQVVAAGYDRLLHRGTLGSGGVDAMVLQNFPAMKKAGPQYLGLYHLFIKGLSGESQFNNIKKLLDQIGNLCNYPLTLDVEPLGSDVFTNTQTEVVVPLLDLCQRLTVYLGYRPVIYTAEWAVEKMGLTQTKELLAHPLHFANYTLGSPYLPNPWRDAHAPWLAWQFDNGEMPWSMKVPGSAKTDRSRYSSQAIFPSGKTAPKIGQSPS